MTKEELKKSVQQRLGTIKGHVAGIERMVEENKNCEEILVQLSAVTGAVNKLSAHILENYADACLEEARIVDDKVRQRIENLTKMMLTMVRK
ncbi:MAG TPA: metal-sensitive transcriptional regulator [Methylomusa anaerophila]|uniref:Copper-sensing transcriptional repressor CsoR n=1 Tax=Methylomusa anaerophila TaxID=1930071 RepID=A0A348AF15_9FIRM|nr:metal-sensitive transcriptional regulator [Methylomusa anaerophila]BBB89663.1 copper-sensing transcriptional repressor CsoR [Methylomusa anaerophila]HML89561.1 metal-sensitive transcriptional regulator [Methylomusa anaerophila]